MKSLSIGHFTDSEHCTGVTVFLLNQPAVGAYCIAGSAPATREIAVLDLEATVNHVDALVFTGGSAFGLGAANGVMQYLSEKNQGKKMPHGGVVPIVIGASIYDLGVGSAAIPTPEHAYQACLDAKVGNFAQGRIGAGAGASVGKLMASAFPMSGGFGTAQIQLKTGVHVTAFAVVNAVGDIRDLNNAIVAGAKTRGGAFADCQKTVLMGHPETIHGAENTTLVAVFTNAAFAKHELKRIAKMAVAGMSAAIAPVFTQYDGDILFCISAGEEKASELMVGTIAVEAVRLAILNAVKESVVL